MTDIQPTQNLEQRIEERIKEGIADLMSDEDIKRIVEAGIDKYFFQREKDYNGYRTIETPARIEEIIEKHVKTRVDRAVEAFVAQKCKPDLIKAALGRVTEQGVVDGVMAAMGAAGTIAADKSYHEIRDHMKRICEQHGLNFYV